VRFVIFCHSMLSDWNHGNAHFLRGVATELIERGHQVISYEPADAWSMANLMAETSPRTGRQAIAGFRRAYPRLDARRYAPASLDLDVALEGADVVLVHEWNEPRLVQRIGRHRAHQGRYLLFFHDTHHRAASDPDALAAFDLDGYDGVLAFGEVIRQMYLARGWAWDVHTWHEAADVRIFRPLPEIERRDDLVWIGNWGDEERTAELREFLLGPVKELGLTAHIHGVRYPPHAQAALERAGAKLLGWLPNFEAPSAYARHRVTIHVPRRPYVEALPGIPTIRPFEALACGIPLVCSPWNDCEGLFRPGRDFLMANGAGAMRRHLRAILSDPDLASALAASGRETILTRHTCGHRVDQLLEIVAARAGRASIPSAERSGAR
jgi:spore maturation protein CgeB